MGTSVRSHKKRNLTQRVNSAPNSAMPSVSPPRPYKGLFRIGVLPLVFTIILLLGISSNAWSASYSDSRKVELTPIYNVEIVNEFPHDHKAFTQVETQREMDQSIFGEGLTLLGERLYQVTWLQKTGFIYDRNDFNNVMTFTHHMNDGCGLASDGKTLFGTDGSSTLYQMDPQTMEVIKKQTVMYEGR